MASLSHSFAAPALLCTCFLFSKSFWNIVLWATLCPAQERQPLPSTEGSCVPVLGELRAAAPADGGGRGGSRTFLFQNSASRFPGTEGCAHQERPPDFILFLLFTDLQAVSFQGWRSQYPWQQSANRYCTNSRPVSWPQTRRWPVSSWRAGSPPFSGRNWKAPATLRHVPQSRGRQGEWGSG